MRRSTAFVVGNGPSLDGFDFSRLGREMRFVCNARGHDCPHATGLVVTDRNFAQANQRMCAEFGKRLHTVGHWGKTAPVTHWQKWKGEGFPTEPGFVRWAPFTGGIAVGVAVALGFKRIILLGFDGGGPRGNFNKWPGWPEAAAAAGVEIVNATPGSSITCWPMTTLEAELG